MSSSKASTCLLCCCTPGNCVQRVMESHGEGIALCRHFMPKEPADISHTSNLSLISKALANVSDIELCTQSQHLMQRCICTPASCRSAWRQSAMSPLWDSRAMHVKNAHA